MLRRKPILISLLTFSLIVLMLSSLNIPTPTSIPKVQAVSRSIKLTGAFYSGWNGTNPGPTITVTKGDSVSLTLVSGDGAPHTFVIDVSKAGVVSMPNCAVDKCSSQFTTSTIYPFTVDFGPGTYAYYCSIHLGAMVGTFVVPGPDYAASSSPSSLTILEASNANSTVSITSLNNFAGSVTLSATPPSSWVAPFFSVNPVTVSAGMTSTSKLTIYVPPGTMPGPYTVAVKASNSSTSRSANVAVTVPTPSFDVSASPTSLSINSGNSGSSTITITGSNGFSGTVGLTASAPSGRAVVTINPTSATLTSTTTSATSSLNVSSALGVFNITVTGANGVTTHSTQLLVNGPDFSITPGSTTVSVNQGASATLTVTISGVNGFSGAVSLSASSSVGGPPVTVSPTSVQVPSSGSVSATLTVTASSMGAYSTSVSPGSYTIILNATTGPLTHTQTIPLTVTSPSSFVGILSNPIVIGGIVAAVVIVGIAVYALKRRPKK